MAEEQNMITQGELDRILTVFSNVHKDNDENEKGETPADLSLSQVEVDTVLAKGVDASHKAGDDGIIKLDKPELSKDEAAQIRARKIAARKAHSALILAQVQAGSPRRFQVSYGSCLKKNSELETLKEGDSIVLDRKIDEDVNVYIDGRPFAKGVLTQTNGVASVKLTKLLPREKR